MATFFRINNNRLLSAGNIERLGFSSKSPMFIPDEYLEQQEFIVMRTCHGIGDWCIISAMPRLLKEKYPNCKVYIPSSNMLKNIYGSMLNTWGYGTFDASQTTEIVFKNNPYVDGFIDNYNGEIFHDHYKIYDESNDYIPLVEQMLKFWQFSDEELSILDFTPDFYPSKNELQWYNNFNKHSKYGYILASTSFGEVSNPNNLKKITQEFDSKIDIWYFYSEGNFQDSFFNFIDKDKIIPVKNLNLNIRQQQLLKSKAFVNIGNETGMNLWTSKYSQCYVLQNLHYGSFHGEHLAGKIRKKPFKTGNFVPKINYV